MEGRIIRLPEKKLYLAPISDIQFGQPGCDVNKLAAHVQYGVRHHWRFVGAGDYIDFASPSNRTRLRQAALYDSSQELIENAVQDITDRLYDEALRPSNGRWLGLVQGHHYEHVDYARTCDQYLAGRLGCDFLGDAAMLFIYLADAPLPIRVFVHHGAGSAQTTGGSIPRLERMVLGHDADIYIVGHNHRKFGIPEDRLCWIHDAEDDTLKLRHQTIVIGFTGGWLKGWEQGSNFEGRPQGGYIEKHMLRPIPTGGLLITAEVVREDWGWRRDIFVSA
jgi:hypothetical protein